MKRSKPLERKAPMTRTGFSRKSKSPFRSLAPASTLRQRAAIKSRIRKPTVEEGSRYLAACAGQPCYLNVMCPRTDWADPTVVPAHSNQSKHGKGMGLKAKNEFTLPACLACHTWLDQGRAPLERKVAAFDAGFARWKAIRDRRLGISEGQENHDE
ncbi:hypothetical protein [Burkholderia vietnamiensis]|uniref:hypothetical protein n=1 Tax=Burkholderia vietnamiensis TaxID=60552 RepID=UPI002655F404|nr:hypothetical protein [Burkholderia vietnamiensis]MDN7814896.1 hypothetical protein [Burkholderia vietnamiensis]